MCALDTRFNIINVYLSEESLLQCFVRNLLAAWSSNAVGYQGKSNQTRLTKRTESDLTMEEEEGGCLSLTSWLIIGAVTLLVLWIWKACRVYNTFTDMGIPGPKPIPLIGNLIDTFKYGFVEQITRYGKQYGKMYGMFTFTRPMLFTSDLEMAREILVKKFHSFPDRMSQGEMNYKPWKDLLTQLKGDHWKHVRSQLSPVFSSGKLKRLTPAIQRVTGTLTDYLKTEAVKGEQMELKMLCGRVSMDVIAGVAFGIEVNSISNPDEKFVKYAYHIMNPNKLVVAMMLLAPKLFWFLSKYGIDMGLKESMDFFLSVSESAAKDCAQEKERRSDFIQLLMETQKEENSGPVDAEINHEKQLVTSSTWTRKGLTDDEIHANAFLFLLAGYETVSTVMSFTFFLLAINPECQKKAQEEVDRVVGKRTVDYETANELTYLDMCVTEAMRLYPPAFILSRECVEDTEVGGVQIKKGLSVMFACSDIHRDPEIWPEPETFDPMRHTAEARAGRPPFAYMPFGMGPRNCIGMRLAQLEIRMAIATTLQHFTLVRCDKTVYPPKLMKTRMQAEDGLWVKFQPRD